MVTLVVLNWNGLADTLDCLRSLSHVDCPGCEVVVVDNGSTDGSARAIRERFPSVTLLENGENLGYAGGNNVGLRYALLRGSEYALLLNNDTRVAPDFLQLLVRAAQEDPLICAAGPTIYYDARPDVIWAAGGTIDWRRGDAFLTGVDEKDVGQFGTQVREVDFITGCALLLRTDTLQRVGPLDERFFAYYEESEWCLRARRAGFKIVHVPAARIWHKITPEAKEDSPLVHYYMTRNRLLFLRLAGAGGRAWLHTLFAEYLRTLLSWLLKPRWRHKAPLRRAMLLAIVDACRGRWGAAEMG
jgi:GT2 family glycosyltransferase